MQRRARQLKNHNAEADLFRRRALVGFICVLLVLGGLAAWYFRLQVVQHAEYATRSEANRLRLVPVVPARGLILDRKGRVLADNVAAWRLDAVPERAGDGAALLTNLQSVVPLDPEQSERFLRDYKASRPFKPVTVKLKLSDDEAARFAVNRWRFPGVELVPYLGRVYPYGSLFAHVIGYVGRIDEKDQAALGPTGSAYSHTGKTGLERYYDEQLRGKPGFKRLETNVDGRTVRALDTVPATPGTDLKLSIDLDLQRAMVAAFGELEGTAVALDPRSGEILAMVSLPAYDTNLFVNGISHADYKALNDNPSRPQFNRLVLGGVAPGSTIKPLTTLAGLDSGARKPEDKILSTGVFRLPGMRGRGWLDGVHGWTDARKAIYESVNTYYYKLALDMGVQRYDDYMAKYGFGQKTGIDLSGEIEGIVPSPASKMKYAKQRWYPGDLVNSSIGQGLWKVTPLQLGRGVAAIADGGRMRRPHLVTEQRAAFDAPWQPLPQPPAMPISDDPDNVHVVQEGMAMTTTGSGTAARVFRGSVYRSAGKTGTAQVVNRRAAAVDPRSLPLWQRHRGLYIGYAPADAPAIAIAVAVEGGGFGADSAAPIARKVFDAWLLGKMPEMAKPDEAAVEGATAKPDFSNVRGSAGIAPVQAAAAPASEMPTR
ncbi:penicillin-binding protein 2 [Thermomonas sp. HDW16]|uniref:penicillin-binding protein 2 n=1 Tax=Thermomonas sp. HDW16 TaxID=2714945 RepID=UPI00140C6DEF|nr:penicillin-binding protein 2 [Thermomonas sp. HDW16]QIL19255.1 penicillin-binding protein 2 [Thermomonas sp. HDW16]